jgi:hypothetical protein
MGNPPSGQGTRQHRNCISGLPAKRGVDNSSHKCQNSAKEIAMNKTIKLGMLILVFGMLLFANSCTYPAYSLGAKIDKSKNYYKTIPGWKIGNVQIKQQITIALKNGDSLGGIYLGIYPESDSSYNQEYGTFRAGNPEYLAWPAVGEKLVIKGRHGALTNITFCGFEYLYRNLPNIPDKRAVYEFQCLSFKESSGRSGHIYLNDIDSVKTLDGGVIEGKSLRRLSSRAELPLCTSILLQTADSLKMIPAEQIDHAITSSKGHLRWYGLGLGLVGDAVLITVLIAGAVIIMAGMPHPRI